MAIEGMRNFIICTRHQIVLVIDSTQVKWVTHVAHIAAKLNVPRPQKKESEDLKVRDHVKDLKVGGATILTRSLKKQITG
jgi:hypothetical protein